MNIARRAGHDDALAGGLHANICHRDGLAGRQALGKRFTENFGDARSIRSACVENLGDLDGLRFDSSERPASAVNRLIKAINELFDLVQLPRNRRSHDQPIQGAIRNDARLGGRRGGGFAGPRNARNGLANHLRELFGFGDLRIIDPDVAATAFLVFEFRDQLFGEANALAWPEQNQGARSVIEHRGDIIIRISRQHFEVLVVGIVLRAFRRGRQPKGAIDQVGNYRA